MFVGSAVCEQIEYYTNDNQIVCLTPPFSRDADMAVS